MDSVTLTGDLEKDASQQLTAIQKAYREKAKLIGDQKTLALDSEYWVCLCFKSREQKEAYLKAKDWICDGDKYLDGTKIAASEKIPLPGASPRFMVERATLTDIPRIV